MLFYSAVGFHILVWYTPYIAQAIKSYPAKWMLTVSYISNRTTDGGGRLWWSARSNGSTHKRRLIQATRTAIRAAIGYECIGVRWQNRSTVLGSAVLFHLFFRHVLVVVLKMCCFQRLAEGQFLGMSNSQIFTDTNYSRKCLDREVNLIMITLLLIYVYIN